MFFPLNAMLQLSRIDSRVNPVNSASRAKQGSCKKRTDKELSFGKDSRHCSETACSSVSLGRSN